MASVTATLTLTNGEKSEFSYPASTETSHCDMKTLIDGMQKLQKDVNDNLTVLVDRDRAANGAAGKDASEAMDDDDDDDDDEDDDSPPAEKKPKT